MSPASPVPTFGVHLTPHSGRWHGRNKSETPLQPFFSPLSPPRCAPRCASTAWHRIPSRTTRLWSLFGVMSVCLNHPDHPSGCFAPATLKPIVAGGRMRPCWPIRISGDPLARHYQSSIYSVDVAGLITRFRHWPSPAFFFAFFRLWSARRTFLTYSGEPTQEPGGLGESSFSATSTGLRIDAREGRGSARELLVGSEGLDTAEGELLRTIEWAVISKASLGLSTDITDLATPSSPRSPPIGRISSIEKP